MALPPITLPGGLPRFVDDSQSIDERDVYANVQSATGHGRKRRRFTVGDRQVTVAWPPLTQAQMASLDDWFENTLLAGQKSFSVELSDEESTGTVWWEARWLAPWAADPRAARWSVPGTLVLIGDPSDTGPDTGAIAVEFALELKGSVDVVGSLPIAVEFGLALQPALQIAVEFGLALLYIQNGASPTSDFRDRRWVWMQYPRRRGYAEDISDDEAIRRNWVQL